jgi:hypothetical protein
LLQEYFVPRPDTTFPEEARNPRSLAENGFRAVDICVDRFTSPQDPDRTRGRLGTVPAAEDVRREQVYNLFEVQMVIVDVSLCNLQ